MVRGDPAVAALRRPRARRLVLGRRPAGGTRPQRPARARGHVGAVAPGRHRPCSPNPVRAARSGAGAPLRAARVPRVRPARAPAGTGPAAGCRARGGHDCAAASAHKGRLRRRHLAPAPRRARRPARGPVANRGPPRRAWRGRRPAEGLAGTLDRPEAARRAEGSSRASCWATKRRSRRACANASGPRVSTTC
jgi:hypothetical protein